MKRGFLVAILIAASLLAVRPAAALVTFEKRTVTADDAASHGFIVFVRRGNAAPESMIHFRVARTEPLRNDHRNFTAAYLRIGDNIDLNNLAIERIRADQSYWEIDVPTASLADAELRIDLITQISGRVGDIVHYEIKLSDFAPGAAALPTKESAAPPGE